VDSLTGLGCLAIGGDDLVSDPTQGRPPPPAGRHLAVAQGPGLGHRYLLRV